MIYGPESPYISPDSGNTTFSPAKAIFWMEDSLVSKKKNKKKKLKTSNGFVSYKQLFTSEDINRLELCGLL